MYLEYSKVASVLESLKSQPGIGSDNRAGIIDLVSRRFEVNDVDDLSPKLIKVSREGGVITISIAYERRQHLMANIDVVGKFEKKVEVPAR